MTDIEKSRFDLEAKFFNTTLKESFESNTVACINVMTDPATVSPGSMALANLGTYI